MRSFSIPGWLFLPIFLDKGFLRSLFAPKLSGWVVAPFCVSSLPEPSLRKGFHQTCVNPRLFPKNPNLSPFLNQDPFLEVSPEEVTPRAPVPSWTLMDLGQDRDWPPQSPHAPGQVPGNSGNPMTSPHPIPHPKGNGHAFMRKFWPLPNFRGKPGGLWLL